MRQPPAHSSYSTHIIITASLRPGHTLCLRTRGQGSQRRQQVRHAQARPVFPDKVCLRARTWVVVELPRAAAHALHGGLAIGLLHGSGAQVAVLGLQLWLRWLAKRLLLHVALRGAASAA